MDSKSRFRLNAAAALMLALALLLPGCTKVEQGGTPAAVETTPVETPAPANLPAIVATAPPSPLYTPAPEYSLTFTVPGNAVVQQCMSLELGAPIGDAIALFGQPSAIYGAGGYAYRVVAGGNDTEAATVYRFVKDGVGLECIVSALDGRILKKQVSTPSAFPGLLDDTMARLNQYADLNAIGYPELIAALGVNPYLWMSFLPPNAPTDADRYEVCLWPDDGGQLVAVVQNNAVLSCEYQPNGISLDAGSVDGLTPRAPRWLAPLPANANGTLSAYAAFGKFASLHPGQSEQDVRDKMGAPASEASGTLTYAYTNAAFVAGQVEFIFKFADSKLIAKRVTAMPLGDAQVRGRYAPQMLPGMTLNDIKRFMGSPLITDESLNAIGDPVVSYTYISAFASVSAQFVKGTNACIVGEMSVNDVAQELETLYEEYVIPVEANTPAATRSPKTPESTPVATRPPKTATPTPDYTRPPKTPTPTPGYTRPPRTPTPTPGHTRPPIKTRPPIIIPRPTPKPTSTPVIPR